MFPIVFNPRRSLVCFVLACVAVLLSANSIHAMSDLPPVFTHIEVEEIAPPSNFENTRRYAITYFNEIEGSKLQIFPTREEKMRDVDLILARVVRLYLDEEYEAQGKWMDEHVVENAHLGQILDLVSQDHMSKSWHKDRVNSLRQYAHKYGEYLELYTLQVYLDYKPLKGGDYYSGMDINPVLLKISSGDNPDIINFIQVNYTDK